MAMARPSRRATKPAMSAWASRLLGRPLPPARTGTACCRKVKLDCGGPWADSCWNWLNVTRYWSSRPPTLAWLTGSVFNSFSLIWDCSEVSWFWIVLIWDWYALTAFCVVWRFSALANAFAILASLAASGPRTEMVRVPTVGLILTWGTAASCAGLP